MEKASQIAGGYRVIFLPMRGLSELSRRIVFCPRPDIKNIYGDNPTLVAVLLENHVPSYRCGECVICTGVTGKRTIEGIRCDHPALTISVETAQDLKGLFRETDPFCLGCLKCQCPALLALPIGRRIFQSPQKLFPNCAREAGLGCNYEEQCFKLFRDPNLVKSAQASEIGGHIEGD